MKYIKVLNKHTSTNTSSSVGTISGQNLNPTSETASDSTAIHLENSKIQPTPRASATGTRPGGGCIPVSGIDL